MNQKELIELTEKHIDSLYKDRDNIIIELNKKGAELPDDLSFTEISNNIKKVPAPTEDNIVHVKAYNKNGMPSLVELWVKDGRIPDNLLVSTYNYSGSKQERPYFYYVNKLIIKNLSENIPISLGGQCFRDLDKLQKIEVNSIPGIKDIGEGAFYSCSTLLGMDLSTITGDIGAEAFRSCSALVDIALPDSLKTISQGCFNYCSSLQKIQLPSALTEIESNAFSSCSQLKQINLPDSITSLGYRTFYGDHNLKAIKLPLSLSTISSRCFEGCRNLQFPEIPIGVKELHEGTFYDCYALKEVTVKGDLSYLSVYDTFRNCHNLKSLILENTNIVLSISDDPVNRLFFNSGILKEGGAMYVKDELKSSYISHPYWSRMKEHIKGLSEYSWKYLNFIQKPKRGGDYNTPQFIELKWSNLSEKPVVEIKTLLYDVEILEDTMSGYKAKLTSKHIEGEDQITVSVSYQGETVEKSFSVKVYEIIPTPIISIEPISGAPRGFIQESDGYYVNEKTDNGSAALCLIKIINYAPTDFRLSILQSSEYNYDYGLIGKDGIALSLNANVDPDERLLFNFKGVNQPYSPIVNIIPLDENKEYTFYVKYRRDGSGSSGTDTFKFKIEEENKNV